MMKVSLDNAFLLHPNNIVVMRHLQCRGTKAELERDDVQHFKIKSRARLRHLDSFIVEQQSMAETFYLSNIVPQNYENNAGFWNR